MTRICKCLALLILSGCGQAAERGGQLQLKLPKPLREISGLTLLSETELLAVADERARIYKIDFQAQTVDKFASLGDPAAKGDFEGIAILDNSLFLVTSDGDLWRRDMGGAAEHYDIFDSGVGARCEVEGLTAWKEQNVLLILCKTPRTSKLRGQLAIFAWSPQTEALQPELNIMGSFKELGLPRLHPSGVTFTADGKHLFVVAGREQYFLVVTLEGELIRAAPLPNPNTHRQTEGVVITNKNTLYLADEGGKDRGTVTRYEPSF